MNGVPLVVPRGPFTLTQTTNKLFWGFPIRFWIVFGVLALVAILLSVGFGLVIARRKIPMENVAGYEAVPQEPSEM